MTAAPGARRHLDRSEAQPAGRHGAAPDRHHALVVAQRAERQVAVAGGQDSRTVLGEGAASVVVGGEPVVAGFRRELDRAARLPAGPGEGRDGRRQHARGVVDREPRRCQVPVEGRPGPQRHLEAGRQPAFGVPRGDGLDRPPDVAVRLAERQDGVGPAGEAAAGAQEPPAEPVLLQAGPAGGGRLLEGEHLATLGGGGGTRLPATTVASATSTSSPRRVRMTMMSPSRHSTRSPSTSE
jgi:hypothetical protein